MFADDWDRLAAEQASARTDGAELRRLFDAERWNYYRYPDPADRPSPLFDQLLWLREVGFSAVDCFWMNAGHAIYGGYKPGIEPSPGRRCAAPTLSRGAGEG